MAKNPYLALQRASAPVATQPLDELQAAINSVGVQGGSRVRYKKTTPAGGSQTFTLTPALPVAPVNDAAVADMLAPPSAPAAVPGWFQEVKADGTLGPNWKRVGLVGAGVAAVVFGVVLLARKRRR